MNLGQSLSKTSLALECIGLGWQFLPTAGKASRKSRSL